MNDSLYQEKKKKRYDVVASKSKELGEMKTFPLLRGRSKQLEIIL